MNTYDIVGDVHGSFKQLQRLVLKLGYDLTSGEHPDGHQLVFVGDLIDRKDDQWETIELVRRFVRAGNAHCVMGNHEFNALAYATPTVDGSDWCKRHTEHNYQTHQSFLENLSAEQRDEALEWFLELPLWLSLPGLNVVHACWDQKSIDSLTQILQGSKLRGKADIQAASDRSNPLFRLVETVVKGPEITLSEIDLPPYRDKGGTLRTEGRANWWASDRKTQKQLVDIPANTKLDDGTAYPELDDVREFPDVSVPTYNLDTPVAFGHYWREWSDDDDWDEPEYIGWGSGRMCVDFSAGNNGPLVAYRFVEGERTFSIERFHLSA